ncbi:hypothetical protein Vadar_034507 [Vaccinium darrowii]|uniref:Uncharacterized protein n=1 Tax=Vaccinium darrowii TaxID=229202 RepID=A0ACB7Z240_9ERIC|nr:hypothetical protein Vadar_034507 [Vaccinium darrowii]
MFLGKDCVAWKQFTFDGNLRTEQKDDDGVLLPPPEQKERDNKSSNRDIDFLLCSATTIGDDDDGGGRWFDDDDEDKDGGGRWSDGGGNLVDLVTETDKACEDLIFNHLKQHFPSHKETTTAWGVTELTDEPTWIGDPLDGTTNFVHGFPFICVSIGLTIGKIPIVGVVYNPIMDEECIACFAQDIRNHETP